MSDTESTQRPRDEETRLLNETLKLLADEVAVQGALMKAQNAQLEGCRLQIERQVEELHETRQQLALRDRLLAEATQQLRRRGVMGWLRVLRTRVRGR